MQRKKKNHAAFSFSKEAKEEIFRDILNLDVSKACQDTDIPFKIIKESADIFASVLHSSFNTSVTNLKFPSVLEKANKTPVFNKGERYSKDNYISVSILPNVSKINEYMDVFLSRHQCGFRKGYSTKQNLLATLEKWRSAVDNKKTFGVSLTDLSKAFDCLLHELLIASSMFMDSTFLR